MGGGRLNLRHRTGLILLARALYLLTPENYLTIRKR